ncbi:hypothetical protein [Thiohalobacter sp.]|uniref:hypothetical protein n=1 Tax=Thiohalobacter sp. TaxID=2025948 RepID=UPI00261E7E2B|nr:hypothetical protein [Thiohalobacter sp.]
MKAGLTGTIRRLLGGLALGLATLSAQAIPLDFECITGNDPSGAACAAGEAQFGALLEDAGGDRIRLTFGNMGPARSVIGEVHFDGDLLNGLDSLSFSDPSEVEFYQRRRPRNLPGGRSLSEPFRSDLSLMARVPRPKFGINATTDGSEWLTAVLDFQGGYAAALVALENGDFRIGLHAKRFLGGYSESFVNLSPLAPPVVVPAPAALWLFGTGLVALAGMARRR